MRTGASMSRRPRRTHSAAFKAKVALPPFEATRRWPSWRSSMTCTPNQITDWKNQLLTKATDVFGGEPRADEPTVDLEVLHAKIGQLALENDFLEGALIKRAQRTGPMGGSIQELRQRRGQTSSERCRIRRG